MDLNKYLFGMIPLLFTKQHNLDQSKMKTFLMIQRVFRNMMKFLQDKVENPVGKGDNAGDQHFNLFPVCRKAFFFMVDTCWNCMAKEQKPYRKWLLETFWKMRNSFNIQFLFSLIVFYPSKDKLPSFMFILSSANFFHFGQV